MAAHDALDDALDKARADAPGPWDVEPAKPGYIREPLDDLIDEIDRLKADVDRLTALAEERLAGLDRLRVECEAWQTASAGWQARCGELEGLLGEALGKNDG